MDAIEAEKRGDREESLRVCRELLVGEPDNSDAWMMIARMELPAPTKGKQEMPSLRSNSKVGNGTQKSSTARTRKSEGLGPWWNLACGSSRNDGRCIGLVGGTRGHAPTEVTRLLSKSQYL